jgi:hypothetical protein
MPSRESDRKEEGEEIVVLINDDCVAGERDPSGERDIRIKDIDGFKSTKAQYLEAVPWKFYDLMVYMHGTIK